MLKDTADVRIKNYQNNSETYFYRSMYILLMNKLWITIVSFFLVSGLFFLIFKFVFKEDPGYKLVLSAYGLAYYIHVIQYLLFLILILISGTYISGIYSYGINLNLNTIFSLVRTTFVGHLLEKMDPFLIWFYALLGIAFSKIFKKENSKKYISIVLILWIGTDLIFYALWSIFGGYFRFFIFY